MKEFLKKGALVIAGFATVLALGMPAGFAFAAPGSIDDCKGLPTPQERAECAASITNPGGSDDLLVIVQKIINTVLSVIGVICAALIIFGGVTYATSQGDPGKATKAKNTIMYAVIGVVICLAAFAIVNFVLRALQ